MAGESKLLAEWFLTDRWIGSSGFLLPMEPKGLYREMLTQAWRRGARLPNDPEAIRRACGATPGEWRRCWPKVSKFWRVDNGHLVNDTQLAIYAEARARADRASERGSSGRRAQLERVHGGGVSPAQAGRKPGPPSPSPSNEQQPPPPPVPGGDPQAEIRAARGQIEYQVEQARQFCIANGGRPGRDQLRAIRGWFKAGHSLADVQAAIERGEHVKRPHL